MMKKYDKNNNNYRKYNRAIQTIYVNSFNCTMLSSPPHKNVMLLLRNESLKKL